MEHGTLSALDTTWNVDSRENDKVDLAVNKLRKTRFIRWREGCIYWEKIREPCALNAKIMKRKAELVYRVSRISRIIYYARKYVRVDVDKWEK